MRKIEDWTAPRCDAMQAAYRIASGQLRSCTAHTGDAYRERARRTYAMWKAAKAFPEASLLVVKTGSETSLGIRNGGIIVEGDAKLNVGLFRASTRALKPVAEPFEEAPSTRFKSRFRDVFWEIAGRLEGSALPRAFAFEFGSVAGVVHAENGLFRFSGDFLTPAAFVAELRAACEVEDDVSFTLSRFDPKPDLPDFSFSDLLTEVVEGSESGQCTFDQDGWPLRLDPDQSAETVQCLAAMSATAKRIRGSNQKIAVMLLGQDSRPMVSLSAEDGADVEARLH